MPETFLIIFVRSGPLKVAAEFIKVVTVNGKECLEWRDIGAQISLVSESMVRKTDRLQGESVELLALGSCKTSVPLAKVHLEWEGVEAILNVGVLD